MRFSTSLELTSRVTGKGTKCRSAVVTLCLSKSLRKPAHMFRQAQHDNTHISNSIRFISSEVENCEGQFSLNNNNALLGFI